MSALAAGARAVAQLLDLHSHRHDDLEARAASTIRALVDELEAVGVALATAERQRDLARKAVRRDVRNDARPTFGSRLRSIRNFKFCASGFRVAAQYKILAARTSLRLWSFGAFVRRPGALF